MKKDLWDAHQNHGGAAEEPELNSKVPSKDEEEESLGSG